MSSLVSEEAIDTLQENGLDRGRLEGVQVGLLLALGKLEFVDVEALVFGDHLYNAEIDEGVSPVQEDQGQPEPGTPKGNQVCIYGCCTRFMDLSKSHF